MLIARVVLIALFPLVGAVVATAQEPPPPENLPACPRTDRVLSVDIPSFVRAGKTLAMGIDRDEDSSVSGFSLRYEPAVGGGIDFEEFTFADSDTVRVLRKVPRATKLRVEVEWVQDEGTPAACRGMIVDGKVPIVPANAKVGRADTARVSGVYAVTYKGRPSPDNRSQWTFRPQCDVFGCLSKFRSTGGIRGVATVTDTTTYSLESRSRLATCTFIYGDGRHADHTIFEYSSLTIRARGLSASGLATRLSGVLTHSYDAPSDILGLCDVPRTAKQSFTARRVG